VVVRGEGVTPPGPYLFLPFLLDTDFKDDVNGFPSISDIYFMVSQ
jgi:hypothetical protein